MSYYPIFLEMERRRCVVIGGGPVAERKVAGLLAAGAAITVISPKQTEPLSSMAQKGDVKLVCRVYRPGDLDGYELAFVATGNEEVDAAVFGEGQERGVWVNAADDPACCDFILPAVVRRGDLTVAVATGGASPALARLIREELESYLSEDYAALAEIAVDARKELKRDALHVNAETWHRALDTNLRQLIHEGKRAEAKAYLLKKLGATV
ncbi:MAG: precorrin-2 dehydrogenase/sirohydrochlorin ferrochelatase family protein [Candidatus Binatia bacterium]